VLLQASRRVVALHHRIGEVKLAASWNETSGTRPALDQIMSKAGLIFPSLSTGREWLHPHIDRSSGSAALDAETLALVHRVSIPPPPAEMAGPQFSFGVWVQYHICVHVWPFC
jgi:hypothetical protein